MKIKPFYIVIFGIILIASIYFLGKTTAPEKKDTAIGGHVGTPPKTVSTIECALLIGE